MAKLSDPSDIDLVRQLLKSDKIDKITPYGEVFELVNYQNKFDKR